MNAFSLREHLMLMHTTNIKENGLMRFFVSFSSLCGWLWFFSPVFAAAVVANVVVGGYASFYIFI